MDAEFLRRVAEAANRVISLRADGLQIKETAAEPEVISDVRICVGKDDYRESSDRATRELKYQGEKYEWDNDSQAWLAEEEVRRRDGFIHHSLTVDSVDGPGPHPALDLGVYGFNLEWLGTFAEGAQLATIDGIEYIGVTATRETDITPLTHGLMEMMFEGVQGFAGEQAASELRDSLRDEMTKMPDRFTSSTTLWIDESSLLIRQIDWVTRGLLGNEETEVTTTTIQYSDFNTAALPGPLPRT